MQDYQSPALGHAEEPSDLKRRYANLERHCRHCDSTAIFLKKCEPEGVDHD